MGGLFSKKKKSKQPESKVSSKDRAILDLKIQRDKLTISQKRMTLIVEKELQNAKNALKEGRKRHAKLLLRRKKRQEILLQKCEAHLDRCEELINSVEMAQIEQEVFQGLRAGVDVLKEIQAELQIEDIEMLVDDTAEAIAYQDEVEMLLNESLEPDQEEEAEEEFTRMQKQFQDEKDVEAKNLKAGVRKPSKEKGKKESGEEESEEEESEEEDEGEEEEIIKKPKRQAVAH